jgi:hypothetical protein
MSEPYMSLTWTDAETGARGYLVIDALIRGLAGGGLRMRRGCTLAEVSDLARAMSRKEAIAFRPGARYLPLGGAKGGIDFDPDEPRARGVLRRYLQAMLPLLQTRWAAGEDLGVRQDELDELAAELGMRSTVDAALPYVEDGAAAGLGRRLRRRSRRARRAARARARAWVVHRGRSGVRVDGRSDRALPGRCRRARRRGRGRSRRRLRRGRARRGAAPRHP